MRSENDSNTGERKRGVLIEKNGKQVWLAGTRANKSNLRYNFENALKIVYAHKIAKEALKGLGFGVVQFRMVAETPKRHEGFFRLKRVEGNFRLLSRRKKLYEAYNLRKNFTSYAADILNSVGIFDLDIKHNVRFTNAHAPVIVEVLDDSFLTPTAPKLSKPEFLALSENPFGVGKEAAKNIIKLHEEYENARKNPEKFMEGKTVFGKGWNR